MTLTLDEQRFAPLVSHGQFFVADAEGDWDPSTCWDARALARNLAVLGSAIGVGTVMVDGYADVRVVVLDSEPQLDLAEWDQVIRCQIDVSSGRLRISTVPEPEIDPAIILEAGAHQAVVCWANIRAVHDRLASLRAAGEDEYALWHTRPTDGEVRDVYRITLWPGSGSRVTALKSFPGPMAW